MQPHANIPVAIVTGFLGSGKTTLISRLLRDPAFTRTAVIVNEFGEIGLDHELIASSDETLMTLTTGCLCCAVRSDLVGTLLDLLHRRAAGEVAYDRVLIETSGLADPAPILHALMTDRDVAQSHAIGGMVTVVDVLLGEASLERHPEAQRQVALADTLLLSKLDLVAPSDPLRRSLAALNPVAPVHDARDIAPATLFAVAQPPVREPSAHARHSHGIASVTLRREQPVPALALTLLLEALAEHCGARLLRLKGIVDIAEMPGQPAVIHGVQHVFAPPQFLDRWPTSERTTRIVFIVQDVPRYFPLRLFDAIEHEVRDAMEQPSDPG